jgi:hypothetical protein
VYVGVHGSTDGPESTAVFGFASSATGEVYGLGAQVSSPDGIGTMSWHTGNGTALAAHTGDTDTTVTPRPNTAILGIASQAVSGARGVVGVAGAGQGLRGEATSGRGVYGQATTGYGLRGYATTGTAVHASTPVDGGSGLHTGTALIADGRVKFPNCVGIALVAPGTRSIAVTPGIDLTSSSVVTATLMGDAGGTTTVHRVAINTSANTFTIHLTADSTAASNVKVAWHVFG